MSAYRADRTRKRCEAADCSDDRHRIVGPQPIAVRIPQAIAMIGLSRSKLYEFIKAGDIEAIKVGRSTLIPVDSLTQFINARRGP